MALGSVRSAGIELDRIGGAVTTAAAHPIDVRPAGVEILRPLRSAFGTAATAHTVALRGLRIGLCC